MFTSRRRGRRSAAASVATGRHQEPERNPHLVTVVVQLDQRPVHAARSSTSTTVPRVSTCTRSPLHGSASSLRTSPSPFVRRRSIVLRYCLADSGFRVSDLWSDDGVPADDARTGPEPLTKQDFEALAQFRFAIRRYLRFSEETVRDHGLAPQQYVLLLALKGFPRPRLGHRPRAGRPTAAPAPQRGRAGRPRAGAGVGRARHPPRRRTCGAGPPHRGRRSPPGPPQRATPRRAPTHGGRAPATALARHGRRRGSRPAPVRPRGARSAVRVLTSTRTTCARSPAYRADPSAR